VDVPGSPDVGSGAVADSSADRDENSAPRTQSIADRYIPAWAFHVAKTTTMIDTKKALKPSIVMSDGQRIQAVLVSADGGMQTTRSLSGETRLRIWVWHVQ
jgi:hypothetical protein